MTDQNESISATGKRRRDALRDAFMVGWQIVELQCRVQVRVPSTSDDRGIVIPGLWHSGFNRIAAVTSHAFPNGTTENSLYAPPPADAIPHLYPTLKKPAAQVSAESGTAAVMAADPAAVDYADIGVPVILRDIADKQAILPDFRLYDVTRRTINCLTLLCTSDEDSLVPDVIRSYRIDLLTRLRPLLPQSNKSELERAQDFLRDQAVKFLEAWHGYTRQNFYTGGQFPDNNLELVAYEAGHAMSALLWELLVDTLELESADADHAAAAAIEQAWNVRFTDQSVMHLQHQISALSSALDLAYYRENPDQKTRDDAASPLTPNPDLPSQSIQAVKSSLDYWIAAVKWLSANESKCRGGDERIWRKSLRLALMEQTNVWQTLITGEESLRGYTLESAAHKIMEDITEEVGDSLRQAFRAEVSKAQDALRETRHAAAAAIWSVFQSGRSVCWILLALGVFVTLAGVIAWNPNLTSQMGKSVGFTGVLSGLGSVLFGGYKWLGLTASKDDATQKMEHSADGAADSGLVNRLDEAVQSAESALLKAFQQGYEQMRIELDGLNRSIAVTYPLVEFFGKELKLDCDIDFLTDVFWDGTKREEEVRRIARAAFGGLAFMASPANKEQASALAKA